MATFEITGPDGNKYRVTAPDDATEAEILERVRQQATAGSETPQSGYVPIPGLQSPDLAGPSFAEFAGDTAAGFGQGLLDIPNAGAQLLTNALPEGAVNAVNDATAFVNQQPVIGPVTQALSMTPATAQEINQNIATQEQEYQARRGPDAGFDVARLGGNVAGALPLALIGGPSVAGAAGSGVVMGALMPQTEGEFSWGDTGTNAALGAGGGVVANKLGRFMSGIVLPKVRPGVQALTARGITPTIGQIRGGALNALEQKATSIPLMGDAIAAARTRANTQLQQAVYRDILDPVGLPAPTTVGREAVSEVGDLLSASYDELLPNAQFRMDGQFATELRTLLQGVQDLPQQQSNNFIRTLQDKVGRAMSPNGSMDGEAFKTLESYLSRQASIFSRSTDAYQMQLGDAFNELLTSLRAGLARSNRGVLVDGVDIGQRLGDLNLAWAKLVRLERAAGGAGATEGVFTPAQFSAAVKSADQSTRGRQFARGNALMQDLSDPAKSVLGGTVPDSGTPGRLLPVLTGGAAVVDPVTTGLALGLGSLPYTRPGASLSAGLLTNRPAIATDIARLLGLSRPALGAAGAGLAAGPQ